MVYDFFDLNWQDYIGLLKIDNEERNAVVSVGNDIVMGTTYGSISKVILYLVTNVFKWS